MFVKRYVLRKEDEVHVKTDQRNSSQREADFLLRATSSTSDGVSPAVSAALCRLITLRPPRPHTTQHRQSTPTHQRPSRQRVQSRRLWSWILRFHGRTRTGPDVVLRDADWITNDDILKQRRQIMVVRDGSPLAVRRQVRHSRRQPEVRLKTGSATQNEAGRP